MVEIMAERFGRILLLASLFLMLNPANSSEYEFGTKVLPTDIDISRPLCPIPSGTTIAYWDIGTPGYDERDPVYLHIGPYVTNNVNPNDVRLTSFDGLSSGSKVTFHDVDVNKPLKFLPSTIIYLNINGSSIYNLNDPVYLHQGYYYDCSNNKEIANIMAGFKERLPHKGCEISIDGLDYAVFTDNYKMFVSDKLIENNPIQVGYLRGLRIEMIRGIRANYYHILDTWLVNILPNKKVADMPNSFEGHNCNFGTAPMTMLINTNDIRLSPIGELNAGTKVTNFDIDQNMQIALPVLAIFMEPITDITKIGYFDENGNGIYDYFDDVYLNVPAGEIVSGIVAVNNVRLSGPVSQN